MKRQLTSHIGLDISGRLVSAVQLRGVPGTQPAMHAAAVFSRRVVADAVLSPEQEAERVASVLNRRGFSGSNIVLAVPDERVLTAVIELPPRTSAAPLNQIAVMEMSRLFRKDPAALELAMWDLPSMGRQSGGTACMAVAACHAETQPLVEAYEATGLSVCSVEPRVTAIARACATRLAPSPLSTLIIDAGWKSSHLTVMCEGVIAYERCLEGGEFASVSQRLSRQLGLDPAVAELALAEAGRAAQVLLTSRAIAAEVRRAIEQHTQGMVAQLHASLAYVGHRYPAANTGKLLVVGEFGAMPGYAQRLGASLGVEAAALRPADVVGVPVHFSNMSERTAAITALGLALSSMEASA